MNKNIKVFIPFLGFLISLTIIVSGCIQEDAASKATVETIAVSSVTGTTAVSGGIITSDGSEKIEKCGVCWSSFMDPTVADSITSDSLVAGKFTSNISGLLPGRTYYFRAYVVNKAGIAYGRQSSFKTLNLILNTMLISNITNTTASGGGSVTSDGFGSNLMITGMGVCWDSLPEPTIDDNRTMNGTGLGDFTSNLTGLSGGHRYYVRSYVIIGTGVIYGPEVTFRTRNLSVGYLNFDGVSYHTVIIGTQVWMVENLRSTHFRNGVEIPNVTDNTAWSNLTTAAYSNYQNDISYTPYYGRLYNWQAVSDKVNNIAPAGWHVPTDAEWTKLSDYLIENGYGYENSGSDIGQALAASYYWNYSSESNKIASDLSKNNASGFAALPGGYRSNNGSFLGYGYDGYWWSLPDNGTGSIWLRALSYNGTDLLRMVGDNRAGYTVRCVRD